MRHWGTLLIILALTVVCAAKDIVLEWDASSEPDVTGYVLCMGTNASGPYPQRWLVAGRLNTRQTVNGLGPGEYYFVLVAVNTSNLVSEFSNEARVSISAPPRLVVVEPPAVRLTGVVYRASTATGPWSELLRLPPVDVPLNEGAGFFQMGIEWGFVGLIEPVPIERGER